jgi:hypothetical protein
VVVYEARDRNRRVVSPALNRTICMSPPSQKAECFRDQTEKILAIDDHCAGTIANQRNAGNRFD